MLDLEQYRSRVQETAHLVRDKLKLPTPSIKGRWHLANLVFVAGLLASACSPLGRENQYFLEKVEDRLEDTKLEQSWGIMRGSVTKVSFWLNRKYPQGSSDVSLGLEVCLQGKGIMQFVSHRLKEGEKPPEIVTENIDFDDNCISPNPVTDFLDGEDFALYIGTNGLHDLRAYSVRRDTRMSDSQRTVAGLSSIFIGTTTLQEPLAQYTASN